MANVELLALWLWIYCGKLAKKMVFKICLLEKMCESVTFQTRKMWNNKRFQFYVYSLNQIEKLKRIDVCIYIIIQYFNLEIYVFNRECF